MTGSFAKNMNFKSTFVLTAGGRLIAASGTFVFTYVFAGQLAKEDFGLFMIAVAFMMGGQVFLSFGTDRYLLKNIPISIRKKNKEMAVWLLKSSAFVVAVIGGTIFLIFFLAEVIFQPGVIVGLENQERTVLVAGLIILYTVVYQINFIMKGWGRPGISSLFEIGSIWYVYILVFFVSFSYFDQQLSYETLLYYLNLVLFIFIIIGATLIKSFWRKTFILDNTDEFNIHKKNYYRELPDFFIVGFVYFYSQWGISIYLGNTTDESEVANLSIALRVGMIIAFLQTIYDAILAPRFATNYDSYDLQKIKTDYFKSTKVLALVPLFPAIVLVIYPDFIFLAFSEDYRDALRAVQILVFSNYIYVATGPSLLLLLMTGYQFQVRNILLVSLFALLSISWLLVPILGSVGAAFAIAAFLIIQKVFSTYLIFKYKLVSIR